MGVFGAVVGRRGAVGFTLARISGCRGVIGFIVGTWLCPVREKVRPACSERPAIGYLWRAGRFFRDNAARGAALGEFCRAAGLMLLMLGERCRAVGVAGMPCDYTWAWPGVPPTDHSQAEADWALLPQTNRPPSRHAGAGGNTKNQAATRNAIAANGAKAVSSTRVAHSLLLERHAVHVGFAQLEAGALVQAVRGLARGA